MAAVVEPSPAEISALCALVRERFGLHFPVEKKAEVIKAWKQVADGVRLGALTLTPDAPGHGETLQKLLNRLTVGETYFFRIQPHFDALRNFILPQLFQARAGTKRLQIWSAGCATGEEPYSVAMLLMEMAPPSAGWEFSILGTDINTDFVAAARRGFYREWSFRKVEDYWRQKYFRPEGDGYVLAEDVRRLVRFERANLLDGAECARAAGPEAFDLILCRNVTIYFDENALARAGRGIVGRLAPGGWYLAGHAEPLWAQEGVELVSFPGAIVYRRHSGDEEPEPVKRRARPVSGRTPRRPASARPTPSTVTAARPEPGAGGDELERVDRLIAQGDDEAALEACRRLAAAGDGRAGVEWRMGRALGNLGRYEDALACCGRAAAADPVSPYPYYIAALIHEELGENDLAFENLRRSLFVDKGFILGHFSMANYYRWRRDDGRAAKSYGNVLKLLEGRSADEEISGDGLTVARLRQIVAHIL